MSDLLTACKMAYRKHHLDDDSIGWDELADHLLNALCNAMGTDEFEEWSKLQGASIINRHKIIPTSTELDWEKAKAHFDLRRQNYQNLEGMEGVNTTLALRYLFDPLAVRYNREERTKELHDEMLSVE